MDHSPETRLIGNEECANLLRVTTRTLLSWRSLPVDPLPSYRPGKAYLYDAAEVLRWSRRRARAQRGQTVPTL